MPKLEKRLIVSFVGNQDLKHYGIVDGPRRDDDSSPILRLLQELSSRGEVDAATEILLFDDEPGVCARDDPGRSNRQLFAALLEADLARLGIRACPIRVEPVTGHLGPTDLRGLFDAVWHHLDLPSEKRPDDIVFHISSGTPAMHLTQMLAALCLYERSRIFETSNRAGHSATEIKPPYVLGLSRKRRPHAPGLSRLNDQARNTLLPGAVVDDPFVAAEYAALWTAARRGGERAPRVLIRGPAGAGKWRAARQFACWRGTGHPVIEWPQVPDWAALAPIAQRTTVLISHLDAWSSDALDALHRWLTRNPAAAVAATWRDDRPPRTPLQQATADGLRGAAQVVLPAFPAREDKLALARAMAQARGLHTGYLDKRLQYELLQPSAPRSLHELDQVLAHAASRSQAGHPEASALEQAQQMLRAQEALSVLHDAFEQILRLQITPGRGLDKVLDDVKHAAARMAAEGGRTQEEVAARLGVKRSAVGNWLRAEIDPAHWPSLRGATRAGGDAG